MKKYPSQERLKELFDYDLEGFLVWKYRPGLRPCVNSRFTGKRAGSFGVMKNLKTFNEVGIDGCRYRVSEIIWIYHNGAIPNGMSVVSDNSENIKISDIRLLTRYDRTGVQHSALLRNGYIGVSEKSGNFVTKYDGKHLGTFKSAAAAAACVDCEIRKKHGEDSYFNLNKEYDYESERITSRQIQKKRRNNGRMQGAYFDKRKKLKPWYSKMLNRHLGVFKTETEAARAYNIAAYEHYGEHAVLNDIPDPLGKGDAF